MQEDNKYKLGKLAQELHIGNGAPPETVINKLNLLKTLPKEVMVEALNYFANIETDPKILLHIVQQMAKAKYKSSAEVLINLLTDYKSPEEQEKYLKVRCTAASALGEIKDDSAVLPLMYIMNDKNENYKLRLWAAEALGKIGNTYAVSPLINIANDENEKSVYLRESAVKALGMIGDERAVDPLINLIETKKGLIDKFTFLKEKAVEALGKLKFNKDKRLSALKRALLDESPHIKISAMEALCEIEDENVEYLLSPMIYDPHEEVARNAIVALYNIEGLEYIVDLLDRSDLPGWCRDEINDIIEEDGEDDEEE